VSGDRVLVAGAGTMGRGIAQVCATAGQPVLLCDADPDALAGARAAIRSSLQRQYERGSLAEHPPTVADRIRFATSLPDAPVPDVGVAIEAVPERESLKRRVLSALETACPPDAWLATNTSGIPIGVLATALRRPQRFAGVHFFNPVPAMLVVELVAGELTSPEALAALAAWCTSLGKEPIPVRQDVPGFVLNRVAMAASNEAIRLVQDGVVTAEDLDRGVKGAFGWRMGPLETADLVGLDVVLAARTQVFERSGDPRFEPPRLLRELVERGDLGRKTGRGFYEYGG